MFVSLAIFSLFFVVFLTAALGIGFVLSLFLPFTWFETTLLSLLGMFMTVRVLQDTLSRFATNSLLDEEEFEDQILQIPQSRFKDEEGRLTNASALHYFLANAVFDSIYPGDGPAAGMGELQAQELAVRLAEVAVDIIRVRRANARSLNVTHEQFVRRMQKRGERVYSKEFLDPALDAINEELDMVDAIVRNVVREQAWDDKASIAREVRAARFG